MKHGWSLERKDWTELEKLVGKRKWTSVPFEPLYADDLPPKPGIYAICTHGTKASGGLLKEIYNAVYVGKSSNLRKRFKAHCQQPKREIRNAQSAFKNASLKFWFVQTDASDIDRIETTMIDCLGPPANQVRGIAGRIGKPVSI